MTKPGAHAAGPGAVPGQRASEQQWRPTAAEQLVAEAAGGGQRLDLAETIELTAATEDRVDAKGGGEARRVRAKWLIDLLSGRTDVSLHPRGLLLVNAVLTGDADWQHRELAVPVPLVEGVSIRIWTPRNAAACWCRCLARCAEKGSTWRASSLRAA